MVMAENRLDKAQSARMRKRLAQAFLTLESEDEVMRFLLDLTTPGELAAFAERLEIARRLRAGRGAYRDIAMELGASTTTVARVARFLKQEPHQGYDLVLKRMEDSGNG